MSLHSTRGYSVIRDWLAETGRNPFLFQEQTWQELIVGGSGLVNAPTGCGKTFSVYLGALIDFINRNPDYKSRKNNGLQLLWITPLRALAKDIGRAMEEVIAQTGLSWSVGIRNGDTDLNERQRQKRRMPEVLIITPESLHLLLAQKDYPEVFKSLRVVAVDEWHELLGSKRGVQVELAISRLVGLRTREPAESRIPFQVWGISATIGNLEQAKEVLLRPLSLLENSSTYNADRYTTIKAEIHKLIDVESVFPDEIEKYPWAGHLGLKLVDKVIPILDQSRTTLLFINTRGMSETWYQTLLTVSLNAKRRVCRPSNCCTCVCVAIHKKPFLSRAMLITSAVLRPASSCILLS